MKHIEEIHIADFAPFKDFSVKCGDVNLIVGDNDSGKTRLLEWLETEPPNYYNAEAAWWVNSEANITHNWEYIFDYTPHCKIRLVDELERNGLTGLNLRARGNTFLPNVLKKTFKSLSLPTAGIASRHLQKWRVSMKGGLKGCVSDWGKVLWIVIMVRSLPEAMKHSS